METTEDESESDERESEESEGNNYLQKFEESMEAKLK